MISKLKTRFKRWRKLAQLKRANRKAVARIKADFGPGPFRVMALYSNALAYRAARARVLTGERSTVRSDAPTAGGPNNAREVTIVVTGTPSGRSGIVELLRADLTKSSGFGEKTFEPGDDETSKAEVEKIIGGLKR